MTTLRISPIAALSLLAAFVAGLIGCGGTSTLFAPGPNTVANVRVFNALIGSTANGGVNVTLRQTTTTPINVTPVTYGSVSANHQASSDTGQKSYLFLANNPTYLSVQTLDYRPDNTTANTTGELLVASGVVGQTSGGIQPQLIYVRTSIPLDLIRQSGGNPTANALLRVLNAAPGTNGITLYNQQGPVPLTDLSNITYGNFSSGGNTSSNYATLTAAAYNFSVRDSSGGATLISLPSITLQPGNAYTLIVYGSPIPAYSSPLAATLIQDYPLQ